MCLIKAHISYNSLTHIYNCKCKYNPLSIPLMVFLPTVVVLIPQHMWWDSITSSWPLNAIQECLTVLSFNSARFQWRLHSVVCCSNQILSIGKRHFWSHRSLVWRASPHLPRMNST